MTTKEILIPRYKLITIYPNCPFKLECILTQKDAQNANNPYYEIGTLGIRNSPVLYNPENFPQVFQKLEWWEDRPDNEMPKYVKNIRTHEVYQLLSYHRNSPFALVQHNNIKTKEHFQLLQPASKQEYNNQDQPTIESILQPRYKLIAHYPGNVQPLGHIHQATGDPESIRYWCEEKEQYPQVFQKLQWWEHRTDTELPRYMKYADNPDFVFMFLASHNANPRKINVRDGENHEGWEFINNMFPATEQEFINQPRKSLGYIKI